MNDEFGIFKATQSSRGPSREDLEKEVKDFAEYMRKKYHIEDFDARISGTAERPRRASSGRGRRISNEVKFDLTPRRIKAQLDRFVIKQDEAKKYLANAAFYHYHHVRRALDGLPEEEHYQKNNILMVGSTGVGKTLLLKCLSRILGVPFVRGDATKFSKTGYVGQDVESLVRDLVRVADGNVELAACGIVFIDEIDKIAADKGIIGRDITGTGVQTELLKLLEETDVDLVSNADPMSMLDGISRAQQGEKRPTINTRHILFVVGGAFPGLTDIIKRRVNKNAMGFGAEASGVDKNKAYLAQVRTEDFVEYGLIEELVGRLPVRVVLEELTEDDLYEILVRSESSIWKQHEVDFGSIDVELTADEDALRAIACRAATEKTGARGLATVCENFFTPFKYELPDAHLRSLHVSMELLENPERELRRLLISHPIAEFCHQFENSTRISVSMDDSAVSFLMNKMESEGVNPLEFCWERLQGCDRMLQIVGLDKVTITAAVLENPLQELAELVERYSRSAAEGNEDAPERAVHKAKTSKESG